MKTCSNRKMLVVLQTAVLEVSKTTSLEAPLGFNWR